MPSEAAHLALARQNQDLIDHLLPELNRFADWVSVVAFYKALHIVEALFSHEPSIRHGGNHEVRERHLKTNGKFKEIYKHYRPLWAAATVARYLADPSTKGTEYKCFTDYLTPAAVQAKILNHYLRRLQNSAELLLGRPIPSGNIPAAPPPATPPQVAPSNADP